MKFLSFKKIQKLSDHDPEKRGKKWSLLVTLFKKFGRFLDEMPQDDQMWQKSSKRKIKSINTISLKKPAKKFCFQPQVTR